MKRAAAEVADATEDEGPVRIVVEPERPCVETNGDAAGVRRIYLLRGGERCEFLVLRTRRGRQVIAFALVSPSTWMERVTATGGMADVELAADAVMSLEHHDAAAAVLRERGYALERPQEG